MSKTRQQSSAPEVRTFKDYGIEVNTLIEEAGEVAEFETYIKGLDSDDSALILQMQEQLDVKKEEAARVIVRCVCPRCQTYKLQVDRKKEGWHCEGCEWRGALKSTDGSKGLVTMDQVGPELERWRVQGMPKSASTGWDMLDELYTPRRGELTLLTGMPGSGKSTFLLAMLVNMAVKEGWKFAIFSPENSSPVLLMQLVLKVVGKRFEEMSVPELRLATDWVKQHFIIIEPFEATPENIMAQASKAVKEHGVQGVVIDPWTEVDVTVPMGMREDQYLKLILGKLKRWIRQAHVHLWIVVHPKNLTKEVDSSNKKHYPVPTPYDLNGGSQWFNKADWCTCIHRKVLAKQSDLKAEDGQVQFHVQKARFAFMAGGTGARFLDYHEGTASYFDGNDDLNHGPKPWPLAGIMENLKKRGFKFDEGWTWPPKDRLMLRPIPWIPDGKGFAHFGDKHEATIQPSDDMWHVKVEIVARKGDPYSVREQYCDSLDMAFEAAERQLMNWDYLPSVVKG